MRGCYAGAANQFEEFWIYPIIYPSWNTYINLGRHSLQRRGVGDRPTLPPTRQPTDGNGRERTGARVMTSDGEGGNFDFPTIVNQLQKKEGARREKMLFVDCPPHISADATPFDSRPLIRSRRWAKNRQVGRQVHSFCLLGVRGVHRSITPSAHRVSTTCSSIQLRFPRPNPP